MSFDEVVKARLDDDELADKVMETLRSQTRGKVNKLQYVPETLLEALSWV